MRVSRVRGSHPCREWLQETFGIPVCRWLGHASPALADVHYEVRLTVLIGSIDMPVPAPSRRVERAVVCSRCGARVGD